MRGAATIWVVPDDHPATAVLRAGGARVVATARPTRGEPAEDNGQRVLAVAAAVFGVNQDAVAGPRKRRTAMAIDARWAVIAVLRACDRTHVEIGRLLGIDHTSSISAMGQMAGRVADSRGFATLLAATFDALGYRMPTEYCVDGVAGK